MLKLIAEAREAHRADRLAQWLSEKGLAFAWLSAQATRGYVIANASVGAPPGFTGRVGRPPAPATLDALLSDEAAVQQYAGEHLSNHQAATLPRGQRPLGDRSLYFEGHDDQGQFDGHQGAAVFVLEGPGFDLLAEYLGL